MSGVKKGYISKKYGRSRRTIYNICNAGKTTRKLYDNSGRFALKQNDKIDILKLVKEKEDSDIKLDEIASQLSTRVSTRTIERFLERTPFNLVLRTNSASQDEKEQENSADSKIIWDEEKLKHTVFTDECEFSLNTTNYSKNCKKQISVNVYGLISWYHSAIYLISSNFDGDDLFNLLDAGGVLESLKLVIPTPISFLPSNYKLHLVRPIRDLLDLRGFTLVENYPANSSGFNAIERFWDALKKKVANALIKDDPENDQELFALIKQCFETISQETIRSFITEVPLV